MHGALENLPYGVLEIGSAARHNYDHHDVEFLTSIANIAAAAVSTMKRDVALRVAADHLQDVIDDRQRLGEARNLLLAENVRLVNDRRFLREDLQHAVRNHFQLVYAMLDRQLRSTSDPAGIKDLRAISRRIMALVQLYDHVIGTGSGWTIEFGAYLTALCSHVELVESGQPSSVTLTCHAEPLVLDLESATTLGLVVMQLIADSYARAPFENTGTISVSLRLEPSGDNATIIVADDGIDTGAPRDGEQDSANMVTRLMEQVTGTAIFRSDRGVEWTIRFPVPPNRKFAPSRGLGGSEMAGAITPR